MRVVLSAGPALALKASTATSDGVNNRTVEIGVRIAVGAQRSQVVWMVLRDSLMLTALA
ncbi:MAG: FtsX-like permease family protein [Silvibacterium sp.]